MLDGDATQAGDAALSDIKEFVQRFVSYPSIHAAIAHTLWIGHTHLMEVWDSTPQDRVLVQGTGLRKDARARSDPAARARTSKVCECHFGIPVPKGWQP